MSKNNQHQTTQIHQNDNYSDDYETEEMDKFERQMLNFVNKSQILKNIYKYFVFGTVENGASKN